MFKNLSSPKDLFALTSYFGFTAALALTPEITVSGKLTSIGLLNLIIWGVMTWLEVKKENRG